MDSDATGRSLKAVMKELPPELQAEVKDFAEFLLEKKRHKGTRAAQPELGWLPAQLPEPVYLP
jgi:hypothetical protein